MFKMEKREFKFRAWDKKFNKWFDPEDWDGYDLFSAITFEELTSGDRWELVQYTGLQDKNGKEIYHGHIYKDDIGIWIVDEMSVAHWLNDIDRMNKPMEYVEVLGNVFENPEMLP